MVMFLIIAALMKPSNCCARAIKHYVLYFIFSSSLCMSHLRPTMTRKTAACYNLHQDSIAFHHILKNFISACTFIKSKEQESLENNSS